MLNVRVVMLPSLLKEDDVVGRTVVGFDVLRATTTMTAALAAGVSEIVLHSTLEEARAACPGGGGALRVGESKCLKPDDFDLGNSPGAFTEALAGRTLHMATTNGTRALLAPQALAPGRTGRILAGALVNRMALARLIKSIGAPVTLVCAGTDGEIAYEDLIGCGATLDALVNLQALGEINDAALACVAAWTFAVNGLLRARPNEPAYPVGFRMARGARNVISAGLAEDVAFAARPDVFEVVGEVTTAGGVARVMKVVE
jgi:2-phosphosulfolactate phosphatase